MSAPNPIAFYVSDTPIYWYGIVIALSVIVAIFVGGWLCRKMRYKEEIPFEVMIFAVPVGFVGARLFFLIFEPGASLSDFFDFRGGGLAILGGVIAACFGVWIYTRFVRKCSFFAITDMLVIAGILAQSIGRWGNFFNNEIYGFEMGFSLFPLTVLVQGTPHLALFFIESMLNLAGFVVLLYVLKKSKKIGTTSGVYLIWYGTVRAILEPMRDSSFILGSALPVSLMVSVLMVAIGCLILYLNSKNKIPQNNVTLYADTTNKGG